MALDGILAGWIFCDNHPWHIGWGYRDAQPGSQSWEHFEHFVASFRVLKSRVFMEQEEVELARLHAGARLNLDGNIRIKNHHLVLQHATGREDTTPGL